MIGFMGMPGQRPMPARTIHRSRRRRRALEYHQPESTENQEVEDDDDEQVFVTELADEEEIRRQRLDGAGGGFLSRHLSWSLGGDFLSSMLGSFRKV